MRETTVRIDSECGASRRCSHRGAYTYWIVVKTVGFVKLLKLYCVHFLLREATALGETGYFLSLPVQ